MDQRFNISLRKLNKHGSNLQDGKIRLQDYLQNVWLVQWYFIDPPIINGDQMLLHRNESCEQKMLTFKN